MLDITRQKSAEAQLQRIRSQWGSLMGTGRDNVSQVLRLLAVMAESSNDAIVAKDSDNTILSWNKGAELIYGYASAEIIGQPMELLLPEDLREEHDRTWAEVHSGGERANYRTVHRRKDGRRIHVSLSIYPVRDMTGRITGEAFIARDVTSQVHLEKELRQNQELFSIFMDKIDSVFWIRDVAANAIEYVSPAFSSVFGRQPDALYADPEQLYEYIHPADRDLVQAVSKTIFNNQAAETEFRIVRPDGEVRWVRSRAFPVREDGEIVRAAGILDDSTVQKLAADKLQQLAHYD